MNCFSTGVWQKAKISNTPRHASTICEITGHVLLHYGICRYE